MFRNFNLSTFYFLVLSDKNLLLKTQQWQMFWGKREDFIMLFVSSVCLSKERKDFQRKLAIFEVGLSGRCPVQYLMLLTLLETFFLDVILQSTSIVLKNFPNFCRSLKQNENLWIVVVRDHILIPPALDAHRHDLWVIFHRRQHFEY